MPEHLVRSPRVRVQIGGVTVDSVMHASIVNNGPFRSSRFEVTVGTGARSADNQWLNLSGGRVPVAIFVRSLQNGDDITLFQGLVDNVAVDPINNTARIIGRDYSAVLISSTYQNSFCNQTASEIARFVATRHGLGLNISPTSTMVGSYLYDGYNQVLLNAHSQITTEWDLLTRLARSAGFLLFVDGTTLVFAPASTLPQNNMAIDARNVTSMTFHQNCALSDQTTLTVKSWNSWLGQTVSSNGNQSSGSAASDLLDLDADPGVEIAIIRPNLAPQDVEQLLNQRLAALNAQSLTVQIAMPGELSLKPGDLLSVTSGNSMFDADYVVSYVRRQFSARAGFVEHIRGFAAAGSVSVPTGPRT